MKFQFPHILFWPGVIVLFTVAWGWVGFGVGCIMAAAVSALTDVAMEKLQ